MLSSVWMLVIFTVLAITPVRMTTYRSTRVKLSSSSSSSSPLTTFPTETTFSPTLAELSTPASPFCSNASLVGKEVECGGSWKVCLGIGRLLYDPSGRCYPLGDTAPCGGNGSLVLDATALEEGQLQGVCQDNDSCTGYSMAYDGECHDAADINGTLCNTGALMVLHPFGGWECLCNRSASFTEQPHAPGHCVLPDFTAQGNRSYFVSCSEGVLRCLSLGLLPYEGACYAPLSNATCPEGEWLTLNESAAQAGLFAASCAPRRPCGAQAHRLLLDGRCHTEAQLRRVLCPGVQLLYTPTGDVVCSEGTHGSNGAIRLTAQCTGNDSEAEVDNSTSAGDSKKEQGTEVTFVIASNVIKESIPPTPTKCPQDNAANCPNEVDTSGLRR